MTRPRVRPPVPVAPVHHRADERPAPDLKEIGAMPKKPKPVAPSAGVPPLDMTAPGKERHIEVTVSKQATPCMREIGGSEYEVWNNSLLHRTMTAAPPITGSDGQPLESYNASLAGLGLRAFAPKDPVEAMIASQAVALHFAALECSRRAMVPGQNSDVAARLRKDAANSARAMVEMTEALDRRRGKGGQQRIVVERVQIASGGQAIVGAVTASASLPASPAAAALTQGMPAMEPAGAAVQATEELIR